MLTTAQKFLLATGGIIAAYWVLKPKDASAATSFAPDGTPQVTTAAPSSAGTPGATNTPNAGDKLLVVTQDAGDAGRLYIRTNPGTNYPEVTLAQHGSSLIATGQGQPDSSGINWWQVKTLTGQTGWADSKFLQNMGPGGSA